MGRGQPVGGVLPFEPVPVTGDGRVWFVFGWPGCCPEHELVSDCASPESSASPATREAALMLASELVADILWVGCDHRQKNVYVSWLWPHEVDAKGPVPALFLTTSRWEWVQA